MKLVIIILFLLITYHQLPTSYAAESCSDDLYYWDTNANACIYKHGGYFDVDTNGCAYAFDVVASDLCSPSPSPTTTPTPTPIVAGPEENAVYNAKRSLLPKGIEDTPEEQSLLDKIGQILKNPANLLNVLFNSNLATADRFYSQSESLNQSAVAKQITEKKDDSLINNLKNFLGGPVGFYGVNLPKIKGVEDNIKDSEETYEKSYFPKEIKPVTGQ